MITFLNVLTMYGSLVDDSMLISIEEAGTDVEDPGYKAYSVQTDCSDNKRCIIQELKLRESPCRSSSYLYTIQRWLCYCGVEWNRIEWNGIE